LVAAINKPIPIGIKVMPIKKRVGNTFFGVKMGCQAFKRCCLIALSNNIIIKNMKNTKKNYYFIFFYFYFY